MNLTDSHCHLYAEEFSSDIDAVITRAAGEGVNKFYLPAIDNSTHGQMVALEEQYPGKCFAMMGLHPCSVKENYEHELQVAEGWLTKRKFAAVGEIGLDFYWDKTFIPQQYAAFRKQIEWSLQYDLPIVIHSRNSIDECIAVVSEHQKGKLKGVFHCFSGNTEQAKKIITLGFYLGIGGVLTFKNSGLDEVMEEISMQHVLLETDAPYLAPVPFRGKRNEPAYLKYVVEKLAGIKKIGVEEIASITSLNTEKLFES